MDFKIKPARPDGISIRVDFWVETWDDVATLMRHLDRTDMLLNKHGTVL